MINFNELKSIVTLNHLNDSMLDELSSITSIVEYRAGDYIFNEGENAKSLYAVIKGKVRLEIDKKHTTREAQDLETLFAQDFEMGFLFMKEIAKIIKTRLQIRNVQFLDIY